MTAVRLFFCCLCGAVAKVPLLFNRENFPYFVICVAEEKEFVLGRRVI